MKNVYKLISTPGLSYRYQVIDADGLPEVALTLFAHDQLRSLSELSVPLYLRELLLFANWAKTDQISIAQNWNIFGAPQEVRALLREYLMVGAHCKITVRADRPPQGRGSSPFANAVPLHL